MPDGETRPVFCLSRHYAIVGSDDMIGWSPIPGYSDIIATDQTVNYSMPSPGGFKFFRLNVSLAP